MVMVRLNKKDITNILAWGGLVKMRLEEDGIAFGDDEEETLIKIGRARQ